LYTRASTITTIDDDAPRALYHALIDGWNRHDAQAFAAGFAEHGEVVGFDGSQMSGRAEIGSTLAQIFADHVTAPNTVKVRAVRRLGADAAVLRAVAGMAPAGQTDLNPALNSIQSLVAARRDGRWRIVLFQNTPAQFHGRPELVKQMTDELNEQLRH
jgi:uncharacterized protein (TIGR02246 family)